MGPQTKLTLHRADRVRKGVSTGLVNTERKWASVMASRGDVLTGLAKKVADTSKTCRHKKVPTRLRVARWLRFKTECEIL